MAIGRLFSSSMSSVLGRIAGGALISAVVLTSGTSAALAISELQILNQATKADGGLERLTEVLQRSSTKDWAAFLVLTMVVAYVVQFAMPSLVRLFSGAWWPSRVKKRSLRALAVHNATNRVGDQLEEEAMLLERELKNFPISKPEVVTGTLLGNIIEKAETDAGFRLGVDYQVHASLLQTLARRAGGDPTASPRLEIETMVTNIVAFLFVGGLFVSLSREPESLILGFASFTAAFFSYRLSISAARRYVVAARSLVLLHQRDLLVLWGQGGVEQEKWKSTFEVLNTIAITGQPRPLGETAQAASNA